MGAGREQITDVLAAARLSKLIRNDVIFERPRVWLLLRTPPKIDELLKCPWCLGVWISAGVVAARRIAPRWWDPIAELLAASYVAGNLAIRIEPKDPVPGQHDE